MIIFINFIFIGILFNKDFLNILEYIIFIFVWFIFLNRGVVME